ncbi:hypothetical protein PanWU01x14_131880 [Parasponia andersonii]|uniref:Survival Motor Neuron Gemin2-binding domain-containing protein n=1 Tax=Parasponia andersonii TaxID=3476 RepID=A0A2P5CQG3_PARAD|nr:hypothetical protein PanWU01x14_131880 [Parasponia andersonii]
MAKQGDLWDDSALINAFDDAISKYKIMHGKKSRDVSKDNGEVVSSSGDHPFAGIESIDEHQETKRQEDADEKSNLQQDTSPEVGESTNPSEVKETHCVDPPVPESYAEVAQDVQQSFSYPQGAQDYNQLLSQYYELEEQRQQIIQQLYQYSSCNYQGTQEGTSSGMQWANGSTLQEHPVSNPAMSCSCCPYVNQCFATPYTSVPTCFVGASCAGESRTDACGAMDPRKSFPQQDGYIVEAAMGAAERALSSMRIKLSDDSNPTEAQKDREKDREEGAVVQSTGSETDLTVVLNAWYSAGFYTGKYLVEQSVAKKQQR